MYHSVNPRFKPADRLIVSPITFERQMRFLKEHRYQVLPLEDIASLIREKKRIPAKAIAITFDDGYKDNYTYAFPVLRKYNLPATLFVIINEIGRTKPRQDRLSWEELNRMQESGLITIGSHATGPEPLVNIKSEEGLKQQIFDSKKLLESKLGRPVHTFSYPEGRFNDRIRQLVIGAGYRVAVATNPGKKFSSQDIFALKRIRVSESAKNLFVFWIEASGYYNFIREHRHK